MKLSSGNTYSLLIQLNDNKGKTSTLTSEVSILSPGDVNTSFASNLKVIQDGSTGWYKSNWFGSLFAGDNNWVYHQNFGWLYSINDSNGGVWLWNASLSEWWWTKENVYPYVYKQSSEASNSGWVYFDLESSNIRVYEFFNNSWK